MALAQLLSDEYVVSWHRFRGGRECVNSGAPNDLTVWWADGAGVGRAERASMDDPPVLYKYLGFEGAVASIGSMTLRWSSVLGFNDPFEESLSASDFGERIAPAVHDEFVRAVRAEVPMLVVRRSATAPDRIEAWRARWRQDAGSWDSIETEITEAVGRLIAGHPPNQREFERKRLEIRRMGRVLCLSEERENLLMWAHYADAHRGAVIELNVAQHPEYFDGLGKVEYSEEMAPMWDETVVSNHLLGRLSNEEWERHVRDIERRSALTKSLEWEYEQEWRCFSAESPDDPRLRTDIPLNRNAISAVYLGCRVPADDQRRFAAWVRELLPHARICQMSMVPGRFTLTFDEITGAVAE